MDSLLVRCDNDVVILQIVCRIESDKMALVSLEEG